MITHTLAIHLSHPDEQLSRKLEELLEYCTTHEIACLYTLTTPTQALAIPNPYYRAQPPDVTNVT